MGLLVMFCFVAVRFDHGAWVAKLGRSEAAAGSASGHASIGSDSSLQLARGNVPVVTFSFDLGSKPEHSVSLA